MQGERAGCRGIIPLPGFGAAPQEPVPQHKKQALRAAEGRKKRGMLQSAACPHAPAPLPASVASGRRPQETRQVAKRGMPPRPSFPHGASVASGPKAARNATGCKTRHAPHLPAPHPRKHCERPKGRKKRGKPQRAAFLPQPPRIPPQSLPPPPPLPSIT